MNTEPSPLFRACQVAGGLTSLAKLLDVKPPTIYQWLNASRPLPAERCVQIEEVTGGAVRCEAREGGGACFTVRLPLRPSMTRTVT